MYEKLPQELKERGSFCLWKYEERDGRLTKVPYFLEGQDRYQLAEERVKEIRKVCHDETGASRCDKEKTGESGSKETLNAADRPEPEYMTLQEAAGLAGISRQALCKHIEQGAIEGVEKYAGRIRLPKQEFGKWMIRRMLREEAADGVD